MLSVVCYSLDILYSGWTGSSDFRVILGLPGCPIYVLIVLSCDLISTVSSGLVIEGLLNGSASGSGMVVGFINRPSPLVLRMS